MGGGGGQIQVLSKISNLIFCWLYICRIRGEICRGNAVVGSPRLRPSMTRHVLELPELLIVALLLYILYRPSGRESEMNAKKGKC